MFGYVNTNRICDYFTLVYQCIRDICYEYHSTTALLQCRPCWVRAAPSQSPPTRLSDMRSFSMWTINLYNFWNEKMLTHSAVFVIGMFYLLLAPFSPTWRWGHRMPFWVWPRHTRLIRTQRRSTWVLARTGTTVVILGCCPVLGRSAIYN